MSCSPKYHIKDLIAILVNARLTQKGPMLFCQPHDCVAKTRACTENSIKITQDVAKQLQDEVSKQNTLLIRNIQLQMEVTEDSTQDNKITIQFLRMHSTRR